MSRAVKSIKKQMMRLLEMHHLFALNTSSVLPEQMMCFLYPISSEEEPENIVEVCPNK